MQGTLLRSCLAKCSSPVKGWFGKASIVKFYSEGLSVAEVGFNAEGLCSADAAPRRDEYQRLSGTLKMVLPT